MTIRFETPRSIPVEAVIKTAPAHTVIKHTHSNTTVHSFTLRTIFAKDVLNAGIEIGKLYMADQMGIHQ